MILCSKKPEIAENSFNLNQPVTHQLTDHLSIRLYPDCRPNCLETGALQKGLILLLDGVELIEEGLGFGVPVIKYKDKTFFSSKANVSIQKNDEECKISKTFILDTVSLKKIGKASYIDDNVYKTLRKAFERLYLKHKKLNPFFNKAMELHHLAKIKTEFVAVKPRGKVTVTYRIQPTNINIEADFSQLALKNCVEILVLNEQGANVFQKYIDASGTVLFGNRMGAWETVNANQASLQSTSGTISFTLQKRGHAVLFRGWENTRKRFSWSGLSYSLKPNKGIFSYSVVLNVKTTP